MGVSSLKSPRVLFPPRNFRRIFRTNAQKYIANAPSFIFSCLPVHGMYKYIIFPDSTMFTNNLGSARRCYIKFAEVGGAKNIQPRKMSRREVNSSDKTSVFYINKWITMPYYKLLEVNWVLIG